jgi:hypothetical protein
LLKLRDHFVGDREVPAAGATMTAADRTYISHFTFRLIAAAGLLAARPKDLSALLRVVRASVRAGAGLHRVALLALLLPLAASAGGRRSPQVQRLADHLRREDPRWLLFRSRRRVAMPGGPTRDAGTFEQLMGELAGIRWTYCDD